MSDRFMKKREVCERLGVSISSLYRSIKEGKVPRPVSICGRNVSGWRESEIDAVIRGEWQPAQ